jgi:hypothetical protein
MRAMRAKKYKADQDRVKDRDKPAPPHQTGREVFPHPAFRHSSPSCMR